MTKYIHKSEYFYGNKVSEYGLQHNRVDYRTLAKAFDAVLNNDIMQQTWGVLGEWELENGIQDNSEEIEELEEKIEALEDHIAYLEEQIELIEDKISELEDDQEEQEEFLTTQIEALNHTLEKTEEEKEELEEEKEELEDAENELPECYQYYIIDDCGARILKDITDEVVYYNDTLDMYIWGVSHWGTSWDYVLTDIPIVKEN